MASLWRRPRVRWGGAGDWPPVRELPLRPLVLPGWSCSCCPGRPSCPAGGRLHTEAGQCCPTDCSFAERKPVGGKESAQHRKRGADESGRSEQAHSYTEEQQTVHGRQKLGGYAEALDNWINAHTKKSTRCCGKSWDWLTGDFIRRSANTTKSN